MKTILLPFYDDDLSEHAFNCAAKLVRQDGGYLEGLFVMRRPQILDSGDGDMLMDAHFTQLDEECRRMADRARERFEKCAAAAELPIGPVASSRGPGAGWSEIGGMEEQVVGSHGRLFDLIVIGRQYGEPWLNWRVIIESALFESGRPVLLTPQIPCTTFGENVVITWNPSTETARTIAFSMPLLQRAKSVTVVSVEGWGVPGPSGAELASYLMRAGVPATARTIAPAGKAPAEVVLAECARTGADLLIKGAYTSSRLRQLIFGGATRYIIANAKIPVVLSN